MDCLSNKTAGCNLPFLQANGEDAKLVRIPIVSINIIGIITNSNKNITQSFRVNLFISFLDAWQETIAQVQAFSPI